MLDSSARASLRSALWELRRTLGDDDALAAGRDRIALRCETDLAAFDAFVAAGRLEEAVALHRGPLLADLDDDWVLEARDEHAERLGAALARLAAAAGRPADAVGWARRRLALDPLDEDAARDLMRRLAEAGDRPGALAAYYRLSDRLRSALGLAPSAETRALAAEVRAEGAAEVPAERPAPAAAGRPASTTLEGPLLVGRDHDLAALVDLWDAVRGGSGGVAIIGGEAGIGKTRLALELVGRARAGGARSARCTAAEERLAPQGKPTPMRDDEVARILHQVVEGQERPRSIITFQTGEQVNVTDGPFEGFSGMVEEVDQGNARLKVSVSIFGRATPVELEFAQVAKAS